MSIITEAASAAGDAEEKRLKAQRAEISRIVRAMWADAYERLSEDQDRFQEGLMTGMIVLDHKLNVLIKSGKTTMAEANDHQRSMNPDWTDA